MYSLTNLLLYLTTSIRYKIVFHNLYFHLWVLIYLFVASYNQCLLINKVCFIPNLVIITRLEKLDSIMRLIIYDRVVFFWEFQQLYLYEIFFVNFKWCILGENKVNVLKVNIVKIWHFKLFFANMHILPTEIVF